ncbi:MAG: hypothetical protein EHM18_04470 [Acidobacteria bacterium]|nr:MAG: hypothetical protein EHM18_04470 [Acidobacteriota bacterium]
MHERRRTDTHDRRQRPTPAVSRYLFRGRRRGPRRHTDAGSNYYTDIPSVGALLTVGILFTLSLLDAILSLRLFALEKSEEVNPLLSLMLDHSEVTFIAFKLALSAVSLLVVLLHWNFMVRGRLSTVHAVYWLIGTYISVVIYETGLLWW